ncbi:MAG: hypothetical protein ACE37H_16970 [Phycisphaeraceae bacterium]
MRHTRPTSGTRRKLTASPARWALLVVVALGLCACAGTGGKDDDVALPEIDTGSQRVPRGVYGVIRQADLPLDQPTDDAWAIINEQVVPSLTRGAWRGNGMRLGLLRRDQLAAYTAAMPRPVAFGELLINQSPHPVPILQTPRLRNDVLFEVDLTRPPMPRQVVDVAGGENSTLRLLAHIETEADGRHTIVLTPIHHVPSPYTLIPRDPLEKELDGRVFSELTVRLTLEPDQIAVVGLYWPWPMQEVLPPAAPRDDEEEKGGREEGDSPLFRPDAGDPAAPPSHIGLTAGERDRGVDERNDAGRGERAGPAGGSDDAEPAPRRFERVAPPLPTSFGSLLFTGTRIRQPVRKVLLITIQSPPGVEDTPAGPAESR